MKRIFILAFLLAWLTAQFAAAAAVDTLAVRSASMDRDIPVIVILPDGASPANPCPTVYLLHGYGGNQTTWLRIKPSLPAIADREGIAFVCPDGATSWYLDSKVRAKSLYETFMTRELRPAGEERYPVSRDRCGRAITGLSMGGFGIRSCSGPSAARAAGWISARSPKTGRFRSCWARRPSIPKLGRRLRRST